MANDEPRCKSCDVPYALHMGITETCRELHDAMYRIMELENEVGQLNGRLNERLARILDTLRAKDD